MISKVGDFVFSESKAINFFNEDVGAVVKIEVPLSVNDCKTVLKGFVISHTTVFEFTDVTSKVETVLSKLFEEVKMV